MQIQKRRLQRGWSQQQLADVSGVSLRTVQRVEAGAPPSLETLKSFASVFETSVEDLKGPPDMSTTVTTEKSDALAEALAMKHVARLRRFYVHCAVFVIVGLAILIANLVLAPDHLLAPFASLVWGVGLAVHAIRTFVLDGAWERRAVERRLGRPL